MKKKIVLCTLIFALLISMTGCKTKKEEVKLKSKAEIEQYASKKYGKANCISKNVNTDFIKYTLQDEEYNFKYECSSSITNLCIDSSCSNIFHETTKCDFDNAYKKYIQNTIKPDNIYKDFNKNYSDGQKIIFALNYENEETAQNSISTIAKKITQLDTRKYLSDYYIAIYDNNNTYLGIYSITNKKYINRYDAAVDKMTQAFATEVNHNNNNLNGIKYLYYKRIQYKDVENLQIQWLNKDNVTEEDWTTAYYFEYNNNIYFMLDDKVFIEDKNIFNRYITDKYYTSYWFTN